MKRFLLLFAFFVLVASSLAFVSASPVHAAERSVSPQCNANIHSDSYAPVIARSGKNVGLHLGIVQIEINQCGLAFAWVNADDTSYHINHLWFRNRDGTIVSADFGLSQLGNAAGVFQSSTCLSATAIIQSESNWGGGDTSCIQQA